MRRYPPIEISRPAAWVIFLLVAALLLSVARDPGAAGYSLGYRVWQLRTALSPSEGRR